MIQNIDRPDDPRLAAYQHVGDRYWLRSQHLFVAEGRLVVQRVIELARFEIVSVLVASAAYEALRRTLDPLNADVYVCGQAILDGVTGHRFHRGCLALVQRPAEAPLSSFADARRLVLLEGVGNPDNVGGVFRSAAAFSVDGVLLDPAAADPLYRKAVRTSMGAVLRVPFRRLEPWPQQLGELRRMGFTLVALSPGGQLTLREFAAAIADSDRIVLLAGAEGSGLSPATLAECDTTVRIPVDPSSDSLNVVVAVSIALHCLAGLADGV